MQNGLLNIVAAFSTEIFKDFFLQKKVEPFRTSTYYHHFCLLFFKKKRKRIGSKNEV